MTESEERLAELLARCLDDLVAAKRDLERAERDLRAAKRDLAWYRQHLSPVEGCGSERCGR